MFEESNGRALHCGICSVYTFFTMSPNVKQCLRKVSDGHFTAAVKVLCFSGVATFAQSSSRAATPVSTAMPINTAASKPPVNVAKPPQNALQTALSRRPFYQQTTLKNINLNNNVNTAKANSVNTAKGNKVTSTVGTPGINAVKSSACWGAPQDALKDQEYFDSGSSRHMTENISYLTDFKEHDGGHLIKDCDFHDKKMVQKPVLKNVEKRMVQKEVRSVWNNAMRTNHQNFSNSRRNFAPTIVLTKSGIVSISTARQSSSRAATPVSTAMPINTAASKPPVNVAKPPQNALQTLTTTTRTSRNGSDYCQLLLHAWYLDDGTIVGDTKEPSCNGVKVKDGLFPRDIGRLTLGVKLLGDATSLHAGFISSLAVKRAFRAVELMSLLPREAVSIFDNGLRRAIEAIVVCESPFFGDFQWSLASLSIRRAIEAIVVCESPFFRDFQWSLASLLIRTTYFKDVVLLGLILTIDMHWIVELVKSLGVSFDLSPSQKAVVECLRAPHARIFLTVIPIEGLGQHMSALEYRTILKYWLMIPMFSVDEPCPVCRKVCLDSLGEHAVHCKELPGFKYRHDLVRDVLCDVLKRAGISSKKETPYELCKGRSPALSFMRPFGCHVTILNTLDQLGKFDGKSDEGIFVGYSTTSNAFRVYNIRTRKVEENLHITFLENKPMIAGGGQEWLFDIDTLLKSMNYTLVPAGTNSNDFADNSLFDSSSQASDSHNKDKHGPFQASESDNLERPNAESSTKTVKTIGPINTATPAYVDYPNDPFMSDLEDAGIFDDAYDDRDEGA
nr:hypothetical protein [Tanacetum cinerariifolium]